MIAREDFKKACQLVQDFEQGLTFDVKEMSEMLWHILSQAASRDPELADLFDEFFPPDEA